MLSNPGPGGHTDSVSSAPRDPTGRQKRHRALVRSDRLPAVDPETRRHPPRYEEMEMPAEETGEVKRAVQRQVLGAGSSSQRPVLDPQTGTDAQIGALETGSGIAPALPTRRGWRLAGMLDLPSNSFAIDGRSTEISRHHSPAWMWCGLGLWGAVIGQATGAFVFHQAQAWNGSLLFCLCVLAGYIFPAFQRHAAASWDRKRGPIQANLRLAIELGGLSLGIFLGFALGPLVFGAAGYITAMPGSEAVATTIQRAELAALDEITRHNMRVFALFFLVGVFFRYLGILFVIIYNSSIWGLSLGLSIVGHFGGGGLGPGALAIMLPHVLIEILAYVIAAMAGVFIGRLLLRYRVFSPRLNAVSISIAKLCGAGLACVLLAAMVEALIAQPLLRWLLADSGFVALH